MSATKIGFNNFKAFGEKIQTFTRKPITLVYGPNSIGKSSFLHAQLLLEYFRNCNVNFNIYKTNFAGDEIDFGGFENFIHKHNTNQCVNYEIVFSDEKSLTSFLTPKYSEIKVLHRNGFFDHELLIDDITQKLESNYQDSGIKFKYFVRYKALHAETTLKVVSSMSDEEFEIIEGEILYKKIINSYDKNVYSNILNQAACDYYSKDRSLVSEIEYKNFLKLLLSYSAKLEESDVDIERAILSTEHIEAEDITTRLRFYKYLSSIQNLKIIIELSDNKKCDNFYTYYIDGVELFSARNIGEDISVNNEHQMMHEFSKLSCINNHLPDIKSFSSLKDDKDFSLTMMLGGLFYKEKLTQYFGPLRPYPERWEMFSIDPLEINSDQEKKDIENGRRFVAKVHGYKYLPSLLKILIVFISRKGRKSLRESSSMTDLWNLFLTKKSKLSGLNTFQAEKVLINLAGSVELQSRLNNWLQNPSKLRSSYSIHTNKHPITHLEIFWRKIIHIIGFESLRFFNKKNSFEKNDISAKIDKYFIMIWRFIEKKLHIKQRYENELVFTDLSSQTAVTPRDMGLGISQVLPILISTMSSKNSLLYLEQPELHLHPAVQSELADEFIRSSKEQGNEFIIETHSEHLLLRIMKRMRQTAEGSLKDESLRLTPDDICLLYIDNDGESTYLQELRLSDKGTLLDHWPHGFFEEGYKERFS